MLYYGNFWNPKLKLLKFIALLTQNLPVMHGKEKLYLFETVLKGDEFNGNPLSNADTQFFSHFKSQIKP